MPFLHIDAGPTRPDFNAYEALLEVAVRNRMCTKIGCTTCGGIPFQQALWMVADGQDPLDWPTFVQAHRRLRGASTPHVLVERYTDAQLTHLAELMTATRLSEVRAVVGDDEAWLMALGKTLEWLDRVNMSRHLRIQITEALRPQFDAMAAHPVRLQDEVLSWRDLTPISWAIRP